MGYYIQVPYNKNKARQLIEIYRASSIREPNKFTDVPKDMAILCVVDNGPFEAAGFCYNEEELEAFKPTRYDGRPRQWLMLD